MEHNKPPLDPPMQEKNTHLSIDHPPNPTKDTIIENESFEVEPDQPPPPTWCLTSNPFMITFFSTTKRSKKYKYRTHRWDLQNQLRLDKFLNETSYNFDSS